jgi:DNA replication licensing factor MCM4
MIRLAEALAKMRLSPIVERKDVDEAVRLIQHALQQSATDPRTGKINMDILTTGQTKTSAERLKMITNFIKSLMQTYPEKVMKDGLKYSNLLDLLTNKAKEGKFSRSGAGAGDELDLEFSEKEYREALKVLEDEDVVSLIGHTSAPVIRFRALDA